MGERRTRELPRDPNGLLGDLAVLLREPGRTLEDDLRDISQVAAESLGVRRASVWVFDDEQTVLECANQFEPEQHRHTSGQRLVSERYPDYFAACSGVQALAVEDVLHDPRVVELSAYFADSGIRAMLDAPIFVGAVPLGVVCHEDAQPRVWTEAEQALAGAIAQLAANSIAASRWRAREDALRRSEALYRSIVEDFTDFVVRSGPDGTILDINRAVGLARGADPAQLRGLTVFDMAPPEEHHVFVDAVRKCTPQSPVARYTHHVIAQGGARRLVDWTSRAFFDQAGVLTGYQAIGHDVTEQRRQEASLREAQRLEALALFSGGIAHDLNNLLTPVLVLSETTAASLPPDRPEIADLREITAAAMRARDLVRQVLLFARPSDGAGREAIDPAPFVSEAAGFVRATAPPSVVHQIEVAEHCGVVRAAPSDLFQIVSNLCANAVHAMPSGGRLRVVAGTKPPFFVLEVEDSGTGIPRQIVERIFEPFFTTKAQGKGTGLGLSVIRRLVEDLGGTIAFESTLGEGTTFRVQLPLVDAVPENRSPNDESAVGLGGEERVLLVDDDDAVLSPLARGLSTLGYTVTCESSPRRALALLQSGTFDVLVTDQMMPEMTGLELAEAVSSLRPSLPIVLMSGADVSLQASATVATLAKPFRVPELAACLRRVLP